MKHLFSRTAAKHIKVHNICYRNKQQWKNSCIESLKHQKYNKESL